MLVIVHSRKEAARQLWAWRQVGIRPIIVNRGRSWTFCRIWLRLVQEGFGYHGQV